MKSGLDERMNGKMMMMIKMLEHSRCDKGPAKRTGVGHGSTNTDDANERNAHLCICIFIFTFIFIWFWAEMGKNTKDEIESQ